MQKILSRILLVMVVLVILVITLFVVIYPSATQCLLVKWSGMKEIDKKIYVESSLSREQVNTLLECIKSAKDRVSKLYGSLRTNPTIIVGNSDEFIKKYGMHHQAGSTRRSIVTFITLGSDGMNSTDIIAHELCHGELGDHLGLFKKWMIPVWFDDGLATQVDYRPMYSDEVWRNLTNNGKNIPDFKSMNAGNGFNTNFYVLSKHEVKRWISQVGRNGLLKFIKDFNDGMDFNKAYKLEETRTHI